MCPLNYFRFCLKLLKHMFSFHRIVWQCIVDNLDTLCICIENFLPQSCESRPTFAGIRSDISCVMLFCDMLMRCWLFSLHQRRQPMVCIMNDIKLTGNQESFKGDEFKCHELVVSTTCLLWLEEYVDMCTSPVFLSVACTQQNAPRTPFDHIWAVIWSGARGNIARTVL